MPIAPLLQINKQNWTHNYKFMFASAQGGTLPAELFLLFLLWILFRKNWRRIKRAVFVAQLREQLLQTPIADPNKF